MGDARNGEARPARDAGPSGVRNDPVERTQAAYQLAADAYAAANRDRSGIAYLFDAFLAAVPAGAWVLDVGCGPGWDTAALRAAGRRAIGLDLSPAMLRAAEVQVPLVVADMRCLPVRGRVDGIWACASLLHLPHDKVPATLAGFYRALRPGGVCVLSVKAGARSSNVWTAHTYGHAAARYFALWGAAELDAVLAEAGFVVEQRWDVPAPQGRWLSRLVRRAALRGSSGLA